MKKITFISIAAFFFLSGLCAQTFCLRLTEVSQTLTTLTVKIEIQGNTDFKLGSSNFQFSFPQSAVSSPVMASSTLAPPAYQVPTVTQPSPGQASFNVELAFADFGNTISSGSNWTEIGQISFDIDNIANDDDMIWSYNGGTTQTVVFIDDEATQIFATAPVCLETLATPLPVELLSFKAKKEGDKAFLSWLTTTESNNKGFEIQRSSNTKLWDNIGWVAGKGNTNTSTTYQFKDAKPMPGVNYYRLNQIDFDEKQSLSKIQQLYFENPDRLPIMYPNPTSNTLNVDYHGAEGIQKILFYDNLGKLVKTISSPQEQIDVRKLEQGLYRLLFITASKQFESSLVIGR